MRLVFDTNVLVAAVVASGVCRDLVEYCTEHHHLVTSPFILAELREKLDRKFRLTADVVEGVLASFEARMEVLEPVALDPPVCRDPDDDWVLATALAGECDCLITGDRDHLDLTEFAGIPILRPRASSTWKPHPADKTTHAETQRHGEGSPSLSPCLRVSA